MINKKIKLKNDIELIIRKAKISDALEIIEYVDTISGETDFLTFGKGEFNKTLEEEEKIIEEHNNSENRIFLVAEINNKIIGVLNVNANNKKRLKHICFFGISVKKDYWGQGVASNLILTLIEWAKSTGIIKKINLSVLENNITAIDLYKKFGFKIEGVITRDLYLNGIYYNSLAMGIEID
ncbi:MAG: GNAT family N-acetyltransferase [Cyanobacteriota bacterium]